MNTNVYERRIYAAETFQFFYHSVYRSNAESIITVARSVYAHDPHILTAAMPRFNRSYRRFVLMLYIFAFMFVENVIMSGEEGVMLGGEGNMMGEGNMLG